MKLWIDLVAAAGFNVAQLDPMSVYTLSGKIIHDPVIRELKQIVARNGEVPLGATAELLKGMSDSQKAALRERVKG